MSQWISAFGKDCPSAATAGRACTMSPMELRRITRKLRINVTLSTHHPQPLLSRGGELSIFSIPPGDLRQQITGRVVFGVADDCHGNPQAFRQSPLGNRLRGVVGTLAMHIR